MRTALTIGLAAALLALAGCSAGTVQNTATTSSTTAAPTTTSAPRTHQVTYHFNATGPAGLVDAPITYVTDSGSVATEHTGAALSMKQAQLPDGRIAMVAVGTADGLLYSSCSIQQDGRTVAEQTSKDPKTPATCAYTVH